MSHASDWSKLPEATAPAEPTLPEECAVVLDSIAEPLVPKGDAIFPATRPSHNRLEADLQARLRDLRHNSSLDPASNPILALAVQIDTELATGTIDPSDLEQLVQRLVMRSYADRATRARAYLGEVDPDANARRLADGIRRLAESGGGRLSFDAFKAEVEHPRFGIVFTAHPTFSMTPDQSRLLVQLIADRDPGGNSLDARGRAAILREAALAEHRPSPDLTLDLEHRWAMEALRNAQTALDRVNRIVLETARELYPDDWRSLSPRLVTLATWVGYDLDGRTDITWRDTTEKRLAVKLAQLRRWETIVAGLPAALYGEAAPSIEKLRLRVRAAREATEKQAAAIGQISGQSPPPAIAGFARMMVATEAAALTGTAELETLADAAIAAAGDDATLMALLVLKASIRGQGLGLGHTHARLNASQIHNAMRSQLALGGSPSDPAHRRSHVNAVSDLLDRVKPQSVSYGSILGEFASARRLFLTVTQMLKHIDGQTPVRFLIAETESAYTLLAALYFARLFGIADRIEISPLFETGYALEHGELIVDEALKNPHYRAYVERLGRLAIQVGFSDSGRYLGQLAAAFQIERLQLRIAQVLSRHGLAGVEVIFFNTHGESMGRGAHPVSFADRFDYLLPPASRAAFADAGLPLKGEVSFQGGDGYLWFMHPATSLAVLTEGIEHALLRATPDRPDIIYGEADFATEYFTTIAQFFARLVDNPDYAALLGLFGTNLLYKTGSRPEKRETDSGGPVDWTHPSQLRAIPNNSILQQLGLIANVVSGSGLATAKDPEALARLRRDSPRFRLGLTMVEYAMSVSDPSVLAAYIASVDPALPLDKASRLIQTDGEARPRAALQRLSRALETFDRHGRIVRVYRALYRDHLTLRTNLERSRQPGELPAGIGPASQETLALLHAIRIALIHRLWQTAMEVPAFSPQLGSTVDSLIQQILRLDTSQVVNRLRQIFPLAVASPAEAADFGEEATYRGESQRSYEREHAAIFTPMLRLFQLIQRVGTGVTYQIGAVG